VSALDPVRTAVHVREAVGEDLDSVLDIYARAGLDGGQRLTPKEARTIQARFAAYPYYRLYLAFLGAEAVGTFALLIMHNLGHRGAPSAIVEDVAVVPEWQRRGVGRAMLEFAMQRAADTGCYKLALSTNRKRSGAHHFYEALGFQRHGYSYVAEI
jgi:GNAT superfamily N-acetyltransferase